MRYKQGKFKYSPLKEHTFFAHGEIYNESLYFKSMNTLGQVGAWQQVEVGLSSNSVVLGYPNWLLPLPVLLSSLAIGLMALKELIQNKAMDFDHGVDVE